MSASVAPDDIVYTHAEVAAGARVPLLVLEPLQRFLDAHDLGEGSIQARPIGEGHSNVTYLIEREQGPEVVLRRPPRPPIPPSAHDVLREARLLRALQDTPVRVPRVLAVCDDEQVVGCPFYVMEYVEGEVIVSELPSALDTPAQRARIGEQLIDALVEIHAVDWRAAGLEGFGKPSGYLERQLRRFSGLWEHNKTREIPAVERVAAWLAANLPQDPGGPGSGGGVTGGRGSGGRGLGGHCSGAGGGAGATIVHGDYRLGNTMFARESPARLAAVLDWEMATIGDPLADVGYMCMFWTEAGDPGGGLREHLGRVTRQEGFPTREQLIARYEERSGRSVGQLRWYTTLALWKSAVFMEGNYKRAVSGATDDPYLKAFGEGVTELARQAEEVAHGG